MTAARKTCSHKDSCELYRILERTGSLALWQARYCDDQFDSCARYQAALIGKSVPNHMLPNGHILRLPGEEE